MASIRQGVRRMTTLAGQALKDAMAAEEKHARSKIFFLFRKDFIQKVWSTNKYDSKTLWQNFFT